MERQNKGSLKRFFATDEAYKELPAPKFMRKSRHCKFCETVQIWYNYGDTRKFEGVRRYGNKQGENREQTTLNPLCLDDYIGADDVCRVIDAFAGAHDLVKLDFKYAEPKDNGRPPYDPQAMLKMYIYGYMNRVRSSRRLEAEAHRSNVAA